MKIWSAIHQADNVLEAARLCCETLREAEATDLQIVMAFVAGAAEHEHDAVVRELETNLSPANLIGCTADSLIGDQQVLEYATAVSVWACQMDDATITSFPLQLQRTASEIAIVGWPDELARTWDPNAFLFVLNEPFSFPIDLLVERLNEDRAGYPVLGGVASQESRGGANRLYLNGTVLESGAVGMLVESPHEMRFVVSQGCRPIGQSMVITKAERNQIFELGGKPALEVLHELFRTLPTQEQRMMQAGLHLGRVVNEQQDEFRMGDFLIRNVIGIDEEQQALTVADYFRAGQTVRFHLRDRNSAHQDLVDCLKPIEKESMAGALLFSCNGRGSTFFENESHDAQVVAERLGPLPLAGFLAGGEIGPVGKQNYLHGFTACLALFGANKKSIKA